MRAVIRRAIKIIAAIALLVAAIQVARRLLGPSGTEPAVAPAWPPLEPSASDDADRDDSVDSAPTTDASTDTGTVDSAPTADAEGSVDPVDGVCPSTHPIKAKSSSKIFHVPGGANYDRTKPDICFRDPAAAEADGFRKSKS